MHVHRVIESRGWLRLSPQRRLMHTLLRPRGFYSLLVPPPARPLRQSWSIRSCYESSSRCGRAANLHAVAAAPKAGRLALQKQPARAFRATVPKQALPAGLLLLGGAGTRFVAFLLARSVRGAHSKNTCTPNERFEGRRARATWSAVRCYHYR